MRLSAEAADCVAAAPVEGGGEPAVDLGPGRGGCGEGQQRHGEAQRVRVALGHARRGPRDPDRLDRAFEPRPMLGPQRLGDRVVVIGERVGEGGRRMMGLAGVAVEPGLDVARRRPAQAHERGERGGEAEREQNDAGDAQRARREEP